MMDIFDFAMKMEKDGQAFYEEMASHEGNHVLKGILEKLALSEVAHYEYFRKLKEAAQVDAVDYVGSGAALMAEAKNVFEELKEKNVGLSFPSEVLTAWKEAQKLEKQSEDFYIEKAQSADSEKAKSTLLVIADEEHKHWGLIENIVQFLDQPTQWLENAEWHHLDNY